LKNKDLQEYNDWKKASRFYRDASHLCSYSFHKVNLFTSISS
jgi:hypothetical protein